MAEVKTKADLDCCQKTQEHIDAVAECLNEMIRLIKIRAKNHDACKLESPEFEVFSEWTPKLSGMTYGSEEYTEALKVMKPALDHHYANSRHHPEHFKNSIQDMNLIDILEMLCDWYCSTKRMNNGNIRKSIEINQKRFGYSDDVAKILTNTIELLDK
jgi:hypothetical protein